MNNDWYENWLRTTKLPDGRQAFLVHLGKPVYVCFDPTVLERASKHLPIPWPGEPAAPDGYLTPWELYSP
jgi:hypothetical protein